MPNDNPVLHRSHFWLPDFFAHALGKCVPAYSPYDTFLPLSETAMKNTTGTSTVITSQVADRSACLAAALANNAATFVATDSEGHCQIYRDGTPIVAPLVPTPLANNPSGLGNLNGTPASQVELERRIYGDDTARASADPKSLLGAYLHFFELWLYVASKQM